jgi:hypothetical protein
MTQHQPQTTQPSDRKPMGIKSYGSIPHLPGSHMTDRTDKILSPGLIRIATVKFRNKFDRLIVQEKLDGSCCAILKLNGIIYPMTRAGYLAVTSPYKQHHIFAGWVYERQQFWLEFLEDGERIVGEWLWQAHGTRYLLKHEPFVPFDIMQMHKRLPFDEFMRRTECLLSKIDCETPHVLYDSKYNSWGGDKPIDVEEAMKRLGTHGFHGALDETEGAVWRIENKGEVDFLCKYVRRKVEDVGKYLNDEKGRDCEIQNESEVTTNDK